MPPLDLAPIRARAEAATKGPWRVQQDRDGATHVERDVPDGFSVCCTGHVEDDPEARPDAAFIAASRTDIPALCDEVERLRALHEGEYGSHAADLAEMRAQTARAAKAEGERDAALRLAGEVGEAIRSMERQRDALRAIVAQNVADCWVCKGTGKIGSREDFGACPWCAPRLAALEVR